MLSEIDREYNVPKCPKHKTYCEIVISTSKRYPRTYGFYCNKCQDEWIKAVEDQKVNYLIRKLG